MGRLRGSLPGVLDRPEIEDSTGHSPGWIVTVYNNDTNTWDEVIEILMIATCCSFDEAYMETWEVHHLGRSVVHQGTEQECLEVADTIAKIGIRAEATEDR